MGRHFTILAEFPDTAEGTRKANQYMEQNPNAGVLDVANGRVILAAVDDKGTKASPSGRAAA